MSNTSLKIRCKLKSHIRSQLYYQNLFQKEEKLSLTFHNQFDHFFKKYIDNLCLMARENT